MSFKLILVCSDCTGEDFFSRYRWKKRWKLYPHVECFKCGARTICRKIKSND